ncbi:hypothetical protein CVT26_012828 [Gymnopilus dilepis]|uniref:Uncharacterized protein n=1 Tax=Gymnopilus dilepis TaxID=231916 RepID=A0A409Y473_9AGAR|nr:hypothetical protein CVT26_012828 [Gymnopilus dilepis]
MVSSRLRASSSLLRGLPSPSSSPRSGTTSSSMSALSSSWTIARPSSEYLNIVKGIVESKELPPKISRETLKQNKVRKNGHPEREMDANSFVIVQIEGAKGKELTIETTAPVSKFL